MKKKKRDSKTCIRNHEHCFVAAYKISASLSNRFIRFKEFASSKAKKRKMEFRALVWIFGIFVIAASLTYFGTINEL